jgi:hypothetical protein
MKSIWTLCLKSCLEAASDITTRRTDAEPPRCRTRCRGTGTTLPRDGPCCPALAWHERHGRQRWANAFPRKAGLRTSSCQGLWQIGSGTLLAAGRRVLCTRGTHAVGADLVTAFREEELSDASVRDGGLSGKPGVCAERCGLWLDSERHYTLNRRRLLCKAQLSNQTA